jgi:hypothetical protein
MYYLKHEQEYFIRSKTQERSSSVLYLIKHGLRVCLKRPIWWVHWRRNFKNERCLSRENQSYKVHVNAWTWFLSDIKPPIRQWFPLSFQNKRCDKVLLSSIGFLWEYLAQLLDLQNIFRFGRLYQIWHAQNCTHANI